MKRYSVSKSLGFALLFFAPTLISGIIKSSRFTPVLPTVTYYLPNDIYAAARNVFVNQLYDSTHLAAFGLKKNVLEMAMRGFNALAKRGKLNRDSILTIVDFSRSSSEKRMYVIDLKNTQLLFNTRVAHGKNSGMQYARSFSNAVSSNKSSLGFYVTQSTYRGENGYSLRLKGMEKNINDKALRRSIVIHGASYANDRFLQEKGMLGRSFGCPAIPMEEHKAIIDAIKDGSCLFIYSPDKKYLKFSTVLNG
ncbi:MAG TPA: murein L,D-transpeptidase catalytic domain family protein [Agriterribacter sp.]|nr:murein L,D-transpeptidase catalytic domain family protein [Agriterribacter sp.]